MRALVYLMAKRLKNLLLSILKSPGQLILIVVIAAFLVLAVVSGNMGHAENENLSPITQLYAIVFAFYALIFFLGLSTGFKNGASFFSLSDVNILFNAPISGHKILVYGMVRQLGTALLGGAFLLFQYGWMRSAYGVGLGGIVAILLGYAVVMFLSQVMAMLIYSRTASDENRQKRAKNLTLIIGLALAAWLLAPVLSVGISGGINGALGALVDSVARPAVSWIPVLGWMKLFAEGALSGNLLSALLGMGVTLLLAAGMTVLILRLDADYYEDVLKSAEISYSAIAARKEGRAQEVAPQNVKLGAEGLNRGVGASVFYYKHLLEGRRARKFILDTVSLVFLVTTLVFTYIMREYGIVSGLAMNIYMLLIASFTGRWAKELLQPYVYLVPEPPFKKLVAILGEPIRKQALESVIAGVGIGVICGAGLPEIAGMVALRFAAALLFIAATILAERLFGGLALKWMQMMFLVLTLLITAAPTIVLVIVLSVMGAPVWAVLVAAAFFTAGLSALVLFLCRNVLTYAELNM